MYCPKCGQEVGDYTNICPACGELLNSNPQQAAQQGPVYTAPGPEPPMQKIPDYKVQSILLIVFSVVLCCVTRLTIIALPFAIAALVNSNKVSAHIQAGNYDLALAASNDTKKWCWVSFIILIAAIVIGIIASIALLSSDYYQNLLDEILSDYNYYYDYY